MATIPVPDFKSLFETAPGLYLVLLPDFTISAVSDTYLKATMTIREAIVGRGLFEIFPDNPDDNEADGVLNLRASLNYVLAQKQPHAMAVQKYDIRRPDGTFEVRYWSPLNSPVLNAKNEITYIIHNVTDVTIRKKAEEKLRKSESDYQLLLNSVKEYAIFMVDSNGRVASWNSGAAGIKGYIAEEIIGQPIDIFYRSEEIQLGIPQKNLKRAEQDGHFESEGWRLRKDRSSFWALVSFTALIDDNGMLYGYLKITRDITYQKNAEAALSKLNEELEQKVTERTEAIKKSEERYRHLFDNNPMPMWVIDLATFKFLDVNEIAILRYGYSRTEFLSMTALEIRPDQDKEIFIQSDHSYNVERGNYNKGIWRHQKKDGTILLVEIIAHEILFEGVQAKLILANDVTSQKNIEEKLAASEMRFRSLIENSTEGVSLTDKWNNLIYRSPAGKKITGLFSNDNMLTSIDTHYLEPVKTKIAEVINKPGVPIPFQARFLHTAGHYYWMEGNITNMLDVKGVNAIVYNYHDITQRKELEDLLHKANVLARIGGWEVDLIKETVYWSDITREIHETEYGYIPDLTTGLHFYKEGKGRDLITKKVKEAIAFGKPWDAELQIVTAKNNERWIRTIGKTEFVNGKCVRIYGSFQDIDQRKKAEEKLIESEKLYRNLFTNMLHGFAYCKIIYDGDGKLIDYNYLAVNSAYEALTGLKGITGKNMSDVMPGLLESDPDYALRMSRVTSSGKSEKFETYVQPLDKWFSVSLYSTAKGYFITLVDNITTRKNTEQKIVKLNMELEDRVVRRTEQLRKANEELEAFSYSVSHDLRAPLRAIIGFSAILEEEYSSKLDAEAKRLTTVIKKNTVKMGNLIDDLLAFSRTGRHEMLKTTIDTTEMVKEVINEMGLRNARKSIELVIHSLAPSNGDINMIRQVWVNFISNAVKYSTTAAQPHIEIGSYITEGQSVFFVKDNGVGFDAKYKNKLFKVFQRLHSADEFEGTGIGLAIVEKIISKHGGKVWADAELNKGAVFYFSLPEE